MFITFSDAVDRLLPLSTKLIAMGVNLINISLMIFFIRITMVRCFSNTVVETKEGGGEDNEGHK